MSDYYDLILFFNPTSNLGWKCRNLNHALPVNVALLRLYKIERNDDYTRFWAEKSHQKAGADHRAAENLRVTSYVQVRKREQTSAWKTGENFFPNIK